MVRGGTPPSHAVLVPTGTPTNVCTWRTRPPSKQGPTTLIVWRGETERAFATHLKRAGFHSAHRKLLDLTFWVNLRGWNVTITTIAGKLVTFYE